MEDVFDKTNLQMSTLRTSSIAVCVDSAVGLCCHVPSGPLSPSQRLVRGFDMRFNGLVSAIGIVVCLTYTVMSNHIHMISRSWPDIVKQCSDNEGAGRWLRLFPTSREKDGSPAGANWWRNPAGSSNER